MKRLRLVVALLLTLSLASCQLGFADRFDGVREQQINAYHKKVVEFVARAESAYGTETARHGSDTSRQFYAEQRATLANLVVNAEASDSGRTCPVALVRSLLVADQLPEAARDAEAGSATPANDQVSCTVIVLQHLKTAHDTLEAIHADNGYLSAPASELALAGVEDAVRIALRNEAAKK